MLLRSLLADPELATDRLVPKTVHDQVEDLALPDGQRPGVLPGGPPRVCLIFLQWCGIGRHLRKYGYPAEARTRTPFRLMETLADSP